MPNHLNSCEFQLRAKQRLPSPLFPRSPNEGGVRTPIMLRWPGKLEPQTSETLVSSIDLAPTILAACDVPATALAAYDVPAARQMQGINLLDVCAGTAPKREAIFGEIFAHDVADIDAPVASLQYLWCIEGDWKLILPKDGENPELYDLKTDPHERKNLAGGNPDVVKRLAERIEAWWPTESRQPK